ncbi:MAG: hypothetical protein ACRD0C_05010, partial [Acidimicrobiia bacterium]
LSRSTSRVAAPTSLPAPPITPVTHLGSPERPGGAGASRAGSAGLAVVTLLLVAGALAGWKRPRRD